jgi:transcriptional regulator with XRE-family HTH domain
MKPFSDFTKKLSADRRARIEEGAERKVATIRLQQAREVLGVTQEELAERMHMTQPALSRFERRPNITMDILRRYVEALGGKLEINVVLPSSPKKASKRPSASPRRPAPRRIALVTA